MKQVFWCFAAIFLQKFILFIPLVITFAVTLFKISFRALVKTIVNPLIITLVMMSKNNALSIYLPQSNT